MVNLPEEFVFLHYLYMFCISSYSDINHKDTEKYGALMPGALMPGAL